MWHCNTLFGVPGMGGYHPWGWVFQLLFWGGLIFLILWAVKRATRQERQPAAQAGSEAATILDNRFARGELSAEEYRQAKQTLHNG